MSCNLLPLVGSAACGKGARAGVKQIFVTHRSNITEIVWNAPAADGSVTAASFTMDASNPDAKFTLIKPEKDSCFFEQNKTKIKSAVNIAQKITFTMSGQNAPTSHALMLLNGCCDLIAIVHDNNNQFHIAGITYNHNDATWESNDMETGEGSANTGTDPTADSSEYIETLEANTGWYAPYYTGGLGGILV